MSDRGNSEAAVFVLCQLMREKRGEGRGLQCHRGERKGSVVNSQNNLLCSVNSIQGHPKTIQNLTIFNFQLSENLTKKYPNKFR